MRLTLFEASGESCAIELDKVIHILTAPPVFKLPLLNRGFYGGFIHQGQVVPLLNRSSALFENKDETMQVPFVMLCNAGFGSIGVPADKMVRITKAGEFSTGGDAMGRSRRESYEINGCRYRLLDLNMILDDPDFSMCGLKD